jgi:F-type H+-transporting ATPase subunit b
VDTIAIVISVVNALLLVGFLGYLLRKPAKTMMKNRAERIRDELDQAATDVKDAKVMITQYEQKLAGINQERDAILVEAGKAAEQRKKMILTEAETEAEAVRARVDIEIDAQKHLVNDQIHHAIIHVASDTARKILMAAVDKSEHDRLFGEILAELEDMTFAPKESGGVPCQI